MKKIVAYIIILSTIILVVVFFFVKKQKPPKLVAKNIEANILDIKIGEDSSTLSVFLFADYTCTHCKRFLTEAFPTIKKDYIDNNKLTFYVKLITFSSNPNIKHAYKTAICLNRYGNFEELNNLLIYETEAIFSKEFIELTEDFSNKNSQFAECIYGGAAKEYLTKNFIVFAANGLKATPTFVINKNVYVGYKDLKNFKEILDNELKKL